MAKGKNATALFEVIGKSKGLKPDAPKGGLATPRWWFRSGKSAAAAATPAASHAPGSSTAPSTPGHASSLAADALAPAAHPPEVTPPAPAPATDRTAAPAAPERTRLGPMTALPKDPAFPVSDSPRTGAARQSSPAADPPAAAVRPTATAGQSATAQTRANLSTAGPHAGSAVHVSRSDESASEPAERVHVDPERQEIHLRLTYTAAIVLAVALMVGVAVAVLIGRSWGQGWPGMSQPGTADLLSGPARPGVLQPAAQQGKLDFIDNDPAGMSAVGTPPRTPQTAEGGMATRGGPAAEPRAGVDARPASDVAPPARGGPTPQPGAAATLPATATGRVVGINYFIVQSYPDERDARAVVDLLARHGISTTIERNLPGYPRWHIVVTTQGFTSLRSPEAEALRRRIDQISADQARVDRRWKPLTPQGYRWR
ncbi:MAG: hypothetical protein ACK4PI_06990 [Tepidisphaerales bacterium]